MAELKDTKNNQRKRPLVSAYSTSLPDSAQGARRVNQVPLKLQILQHKRQEPGPDFSILQLRTNRLDQQLQQQQDEYSSNSPSPLKRSLSVYTKGFVPARTLIGATATTYFQDLKAQKFSREAIAHAQAVVENSDLAFEQQDLLKKTGTVKEYMERYTACLTQKKELEDFIKKMKKKIVREQDMIRIIEQKQQLHYQRAAGHSQVEKRSNEHQLQVGREIEHALQEVLLLEEDIKLIKQKNDEIVQKGLEEGEKIQQIKEQITHLRRGVRHQTVTMYR